MDMHDFVSWLKSYGQAWEAGDPDAVLTLFTPDAEYYELPFEPPMIGHEAIRQYWIEGARDGQSDVCFSATPIAFDGALGYARWQATFRRVPSGASVALDGVLSARFGEQMRCDEFREWWHRKE